MKENVKIALGFLAVILVVMSAFSLLGTKYDLDVNHGDSGFKLKIDRSESVRSFV